MKMLFTFGVSGCVFCVKGSYFIIYKKISKQFDCNGCNLKSYFQYFLGTLTSSPSAKKRAGWPTKPYTFEHAQNTIAKYRHFYVMVDSYTKYDKQMSFTATHQYQQTF